MSNRRPTARREGAAGLGPARIDSNDQGDHSMTTNATVTSKDGTKIAYSKTGSGPGLIVVCGATQFRAFDSSLALLADLLAPDCTVITYDRRGRGESGDTLPFSQEREIEDIAALVEAAGGRASLLGYSSGAVVALEAAAAGLPIDRVIMYEPPFAIEGSGFPPPPADYVETLERFNAEGDRSAAAAYFMKTVGMPDEAIAGAKQSPMWPIMESVAPTIAYDGHFMFNAYYTEGRFPARWSTATMPVLVANGDASFPFMPAAADAVAAALPNARRKVLPGQDHGPKPEVMAPLVREFLAG
jgi:pimeloyl-ACP methyl ester carboxylesterase